MESILLMVQALLGFAPLLVVTIVVTIWRFGLSGVRTFITTRSTRTMLYVVIAVIASSAFGQAAATTFDNRVQFFASFSTELWAYFFLCWFVITTNPSTGFVARPFWLVLLVLTNLIEIGTFVLAGDAFARLFMADVRQLAQNTWLWIGALTTLLYVLAGLTTFVVQALRRAAQSSIYGAELRFHLHSYAFIASIALIYFMALLLAAVSALLSGNPTPFLAIRDVAQAIGLPIAGIFSLFSDAIIGIYIGRQDRKYAAHFESLQQLYIDFAGFSFTHAYDINPYDPRYNERPVAWRLEVAVLNLLTVRRAFLQSADDQPLSSKFPSSFWRRMVQREATLWYEFQTGLRQIEDSSRNTGTFETSPIVATTENVYSAARYLRHLAHELSGIATPTESNTHQVADA